jgi:hypothetical protein
MTTARRIDLSNEDRHEEAEPSERKSLRRVSRRGLIAKGAGAAAAGLTLAALTTDTAHAAAGDPMVLGAVNDAGAGSTTLTSTNTEALRVFSQAPGGGTAIRAGGTIAAVVFAGNPQTAVIAEGGFAGVQATGESYGLIASAPNSNGVPLRLFPAQTDGPPTGGTHFPGDIYNDARNHIFVCALEGTPGTWVQPGFNPVDPVRVADTRPNRGTPYSGLTLGPGQELEVLFWGVGGVVPGATAVTCNLTVAGPTSGGYLTVYPVGKARPNTSNINFAPGQTIANQMTVKLGTDGKVKVFNLAGSTDFILDIAGFFY